MNVKLTSWDGKTDVSIILINWNSWNVIEPCIRSIREHVRGVSYEILVTDNGSDKDASLTKIPEHFPEVRLIRNSSNQGFSRANNQGMEIAVGRYFLVLNNDTYQIEDAIGQSVQHMEANQEIGVLGIQHLNDNAIRDWQPSAFEYPSFWRDVLGLVGMSKSQVLTKPQEEEREFDWVCGSYMLIRRSVAEETGLYDENFFIFDEDLDWCRRIHRAGWSIRYWSKVSMVHIGCASGSLMRDKAFMNMRNRLMYYTKHEGFICGAFFYILLLLKLGLGILIAIPAVMLGKEELQKFRLRIGRWGQLFLLQSAQRGADRKNEKN